MIGNIVARRYAKALYAIGKKKGMDELEAYGKDLAVVREALESAPELLKVFKNPIFSMDEKKNVVLSILDKVGASQIVKNFCNLLAEKDRLEYLPDIEAVFTSLLDIEKGVVRGDMVTAIELAGAKQEEVRTQLENQAGKKLFLDFSVDPSILGGLVLKVGDRVMDASLRAQLDMVKENIKRGE